jgi:hypothetical protein
MKGLVLQKLWDFCYLPVIGFCHAALFLLHLAKAVAIERDPRR